MLTDTGKYRFFISCFISFFVFLITVKTTQAQSPQAIDSLKSILNTAKDINKKTEVLNQLSYHSKLNPKEGLQYGYEALNLARETNNKKQLANAHANIGLSYLYQGNHKKSAVFLNTAVTMFEDINDLKSANRFRGTFGAVYNELGKYTIALEHSLKALDYHEKNGYIDGIASSSNNIGATYMYLNEYEKALIYFQKAFQLYEKTESTNDTGGALMNLGLVYNELGKYKESEEHLLRALDIFKNINNGYGYGVSLCTLSLADLKTKKNEYIASNRLLNESLLSSEKIDNKKLTALAYSAMGVNYLQMARTDLKNRQKLLISCIYNIEKSLPLLLSIKDYHYYQEYSAYLSEAYTLQGDHKKALDAFREHSRYKDSIVNNEKIKEFNRKEIEYEFAKKEDSIRLENEKEIAIRDAVLAENEKRKWMYIAGIILLGIIGILLFYQVNIRRKSNEKLELLNAELETKNKELDEANHIKTRFFSILSHDLRNPISHLLQFFRFQKNLSVELTPEEKERLENRTIASTENLLYSMEDLLLWSKGQMKNFKPDFKEVDIEEVFEDTARHFSGSIDNISFVFENPENLILVTDEDYLKTILRNLASNAAKVLENRADAKITLRAWSDENGQFISVTDNGPGGSDEQFKALYDDTEVVGIKTGLGLHLIRDLAKAIGCKVEVDTKPEKGAKVTLVFG